MDVKIAASETGKLISETTLKRFDDTHTAKDHLHMMVRKIMLGQVDGEKAHRWLGWIQACVVMGGGGTVHDMKNINKAA